MKLPIASACYTCITNSPQDSNTTATSQFRQVKLSCDNGDIPAVAAILNKILEPMISMNSSVSIEPPVKTEETVTKTSQLVNVLLIIFVVLATLVASFAVILYSRRKGHSNRRKASLVHPESGIINKPLPASPISPSMPLNTTDKELADHVIATPPSPPPPPKSTARSIDPLFAGSIVGVGLNATCFTMANTETILPSEAGTQNIVSNLQRNNTLPSTSLAPPAPCLNRANTLTTISPHQKPKSCLKQTGNPLPPSPPVSGTN
jgi:hypothetical protein